MAGTSTLRNFRTLLCSEPKFELYFHPQHLHRRALHSETLLRWLLNHGANPNTESVRRRGSFAALHPDRCGIEPSRPNPTPDSTVSRGWNGSTSFVHAIGVRRQRNGTATMAVLIDHGADVNYLAKNWARPLSHAVRYNAKEKLVYLLSRGADPTLRSKSGWTSAELAQKSGLPELYEILKEAEACHAP